MKTPLINFASSASDKSILTVQISRWLLLANRHFMDLVNYHHKRQWVLTMFSRIANVFWQHVFCSLLFLFRLALKRGQSKSSETIHYLGCKSGISQWAPVKHFKQFFERSWNVALRINYILTKKKFSLLRVLNLNIWIDFYIEAIMLLSCTCYFQCGLSLYIIDIGLHWNIKEINGTIFWPFHSYCTCNVWQYFGPNIQRLWWICVQIILFFS